MQSQSSLRLDASSYELPHHLLKPPSRVTLPIASPSSDELKPTLRNEIFQAKTQAEITRHYNTLCATYGKWSAETYMKILGELNKEEEKIPPLAICPQPELGKMKCKDVKKTIQMNDVQCVPPKYNNIKVDCRLYKITSPPQSPTLGTHHGEPDFQLEPTYKKIFKNAKLNRKTKDDVASEDMVTLRSSIRKEKNVVLKEQCDKGSAQTRKPCELVKEAANNYLVNVRTSKSERKKVSFGTASFTTALDDVERYYQNKPMQAILECNLEDQIQLMRATLKPNVMTDESGPDVLGDSGFRELGARCLNDYENIAEFQNMFNDSRWRKKFDLRQIEESDDDDTLDVSDIASSESDSMCSGDSLGTELDYKPKPVLPSRIPCISEVQQMSDILFDKISIKWERAIKKNFMDPNIKPCFRTFSHALRLRSTAPVYSDLMKLLEPYDDVYTKKYTPHKYRMMDKFAKIDTMQKNKEDLVKQLRSFESHQIQKGLGRKSRPSVRYVGINERDRYKCKNQRLRLKRIIRDTERRDKEGLTDWSKQALAEDYVNLKPLIRTKNQLDSRPTVPDDFTKEPTFSSQKTPFAPVIASALSLRSLRDFGTSLFLGTNKSPLKKDKSPSKPILSTVHSRSRVRMAM